MPRLSVIQVGAGMWGRTWAEVVIRARGFRLAAVVDGSAPARTWAKRELGVPVFDSFEKALDGVDADVVLLASPPSSHRVLTEAAVARGLHVVTEKPVALDLGVPHLHPEQHHHPRLDLGHPRPLDVDRRLTATLDERPHRAESLDG